VRRPVERAKEGAGGDGWIGGVQGSGACAGGHQPAHTALVGVAFGDDAGAQPRREGVDLQVRGRAFDFVEQAEHVRDGEVAESKRQRSAIVPGSGESDKQPIRRTILTEEEQLVLAAEVVIEVAWR
jgi:hypothetical protein